MILVAALGASLIARQANRRSWPRALITVPLALLAWVGMSREGMIDNFVRWLAPGWTWSLVAIGLATSLLFLALRSGRVSPVIAVWICFSIAFIASFSLTNPRGGVGGGVGSCFVDSERFIPGSFREVVLDVLPNVALYAPLGLGLAAAGLGTRKLVIVSGLAAATIEVIQALGTDRVCAPRDVFANVLGALVGAAVLASLVRLGGRPAASDDCGVDGSAQNSDSVNDEAGTGFFGR